MITPQYTFDNKGKKIGVFLAIDDWDQLRTIPGVEELAQSDTIPDWQMELGKAELKNIAGGNTELKEWSEARKQFKL